ncbi:MAG: cation:proton antiporter, partial [Phycisphaerae bacterium]
MKRALTLVFTLLATICAVAALRLSHVDFENVRTIDVFGNFSLQIPPGLHYAALSMGLLVLGGFLAGELAASIALPRVTAYLLFGIVVGPSLASWLPKGFPTLVPQAELNYLEFVQALAVSLIGLIAGSELKIPFLRTAGSRICKMLAFESAGVALSVCVLLVVVAGAVPLLAQRTPNERWFLIAVLTALISASSPAVVVAILRETQASGPFAQTSLAMVVLKDLVLVIVISALLAAWTSGQSQGTAWEATFGVSWHLAGSLLVGLIFALVLGVIAKRTRFRLDMVMVIAGFAIALSGKLLNVAPLIVGITAGFALTNLSPNTSRRLFSSIDNILPTTYVIFFATTGAKISLDSLMIIWPLAVGACAVRFVGCWSGLRIGCRVAGASDLERKWLWTSMVSQAGVSIALASEIHRVFAQQEWAVQLQSFMLATIVINEVIGPPLM